MYNSVVTTIIGGGSAIQDSENLDIGIIETEMFQSDSKVDGVNAQNDTGLVIYRLNQQVIDLTSVINSCDTEIDRLVNELELFVCKDSKHRFVDIIITPCCHTTCSRCMEVFVNSYIMDSRSRKNCPCCNTTMQQVDRMYFS